MKKKQKIGDITLYFEECPKCGTKRKFDKEKFKGTAGMTLAGLGTTLMFGSALVGPLAVIGVVKLVMAGSISTAAAARYLSLNYHHLNILNEKKFFTCPKCYNSQIFVK